MKHKQNQQKSNRPLVISLLVITVLGAAVIGIIIKTRQTEAAASTKQSATVSVPSQFSFDAAAAPGWVKGPTNKTSLALFNSDRSCFISVDHKTGTVDAASEIQKTQTSLTKDGYTVTADSTLDQTISAQQYKLSQYNVTGAGSSGQLYGGQEFGYVQLTDGYIAVAGYCNTSDQLPSSLPAIQALKFDAAK